MTASYIDHLEQLFELRTEGLLSEDEFTLLKKRLIDAFPATGAQQQTMSSREFIAAGPPSPASRSSWGLVTAIGTGSIVVLGAAIAFIASDGGVPWGLPGCGASDTRAAIEKLVTNSLLEPDGKPLLPKLQVKFGLSNIRERLHSSSKKRLCIADINLHADRSSGTDPEQERKMQEAILFLFGTTTLKYSIQKLDNGKNYYRLDN